MKKKKIDKKTKRVREIRKELGERDFFNDLVDITATHIQEELPIKNLNKKNIQRITREVAKGFGLNPPETEKLIRLVLADFKRKVVLNVELTQEETDNLYTNLEDQLHYVKNAEDENNPYLMGLQKLVKALKKIAQRTRL